MLSVIRFPVITRAQLALRGEQGARRQDSRPDGWEGVPNLGKAILGNETRLGVLVEAALGIGRATPIAERLGVERCDVSKHMALLFGLSP